MPFPYLLALCRGSSLDQEDNNITLFSLVEMVTVTELLPTILPLEVHAYYEFPESERGREYELRIVMVSEERGSEQVSDSLMVVSHHPRHRVRIQGVPVAWPGRRSVFSEIRPRGSELTSWERSAHRWPLEVSWTGAAPAGWKYVLLACS